MLPYVLLTRQMLPSMLERSCRSGIINVSSLVMVAPGTPFNSVYAGTKAFDHSFSKGLTYEASKNVDVMCLRPSLVESNMSKLKKGVAAIGALDCAKGTLDKLGWDVTTEGPWLHVL